MLMDCADLREIPASLAGLLSLTSVVAEGGAVEYIKESQVPSGYAKGRYYYNVHGDFVYYDPYWGTWVYYYGPPAPLVACWNGYYPWAPYYWGVGYYGAHPGEEELDESAAPGDDFLAEVIRSARPSVARHAIALAEPRLSGGDGLLDALRFADTAHR